MLSEIVICICAPMTKCGSNKNFAMNFRAFRVFRGQYLNFDDDDSTG